MPHRAARQNEATRKARISSRRTVPALAIANGISQLNRIDKRNVLKRTLNYKSDFFLMTVRSWPSVNLSAVMQLKYYFFMSLIANYKIINHG